MGALKFCFTLCFVSFISKFTESVNNFTTIIGSTTTISCKSSLNKSYSMYSPSGVVLYEVSPSGTFTTGSNTQRYHINAYAAGIINITVDLVNSTDAGLYKTDGKFFKEEKSCAFLIVTDNPKTPHLSVSPKEAFVGENITFTCNSTTQRWPEDQPTNLTYAYHGIEGTRNGLDLMVKIESRNQKGLNVTCNATDDLGLMSDSSNVITLDPYYGPGTVDTGSIQQAYNITEGETLGPFKCTADCNPPCAIGWTSNTSKIDKTEPTLNITKIERSQSGTYFCMASHTYDDRRNKSKAISVNVLYGPDEVHIESNQTTITISEGGTLGPFNCTAECNPPCQIQWKTNITGSFTAVSIQSKSKSILNIINISRNQSGTYRCKAQSDNGKKNKRKDMMVNVNYGPDEVHIMPNTQTLNITEGDTLGPYNCSADCNPSCNIEWETEGQIRSSESSLSIANITRNDSGVFGCIATRKLDVTTSKRKNITINVQYPSIIKEIYLNDARCVKVCNFSETKNLNISMIIDSNPDSSVYLNKFNSSNRTTDPHKSGNNYTFHLHGLRCEDSGNYTIVAFNGIKSKSIKTVKLDIQCKPRNISFDSKLIGTTKGKVESITFTVVANPRPDIKWIRETGHIWNVTEIGKSQYRCFSKITVYNESYFGVYGVKICDILVSDCTEQNITVKAEGKPDPPQKLSMEDKSHNWARFYFVAGFDGGRKQTFTFQCRPIDTSIENIIERTIVTNETRKDAEVHYTIKGLLPNTKYNLTLIAANAHGSSTTFLDFETNTEPISEYTMSTGSIAVIIIVIVIVMLGGLVASIVFKRWRGKAKDDTNTEKVPIQDLKSNDKENEEVTDEYACVSKGRKNGETTKNSGIEQNIEYAEVDRSNRSKAYSEEDGQDEAIYSNQEQAKLLQDEKTPYRTRNRDGLTYVQIEFPKTRSSKQKREIIHGADSRTVYVDIDFTIIADPLPTYDDDDADDDNSGESGKRST